MENPAPQDRGERFVALYTKAQHRLFRLLLTMVSRPNEAEDLLQRVAQIMWRKFDPDEHADGFFTWGCGIARLEALKHHRAEGTRRRYLSPTVLERLADLQIERNSTFESQVAALDACLGRLSEPDAELIRARYYTDDSIEDLAVERRQTSNALYKALQRIRKQLFDCVTRTLEREAQP